MLSLLSDCHFWTLRDEVRIESTDFDAFRYARNRDIHYLDVRAQAKRSYIECRSGVAVPKNGSKSTGRLKKKVKKLDDLLRSQRVVYSQWQDAAIVLLLFSTGLIGHICVDIYTGDILRMVFEKYFVGKLAAECISDAFFTHSHIVLSYNTNQLTVVYLQKPNLRPAGIEKISNMDPRIFHVLIPVAGERKLARQLAVNSSFDLFISWTKSSQSEIYPWRPSVCEQDRANIHVFKLEGSALESISYCWTENNPVCVEFLRLVESKILTVEEKVSHNGEITAEICLYEISTGKMKRTILTSVTIKTHICCCAFSPDQEKLFVGTVDRFVCLHDLVERSTKFVSKAEIVPKHCSWHSDSSIIIIANDRSQLQCFDLALSSIASRLHSGDAPPSIVLDISHYFNIQPTLLRMTFSLKPDLANFSQVYAQFDSFLLVLFENGPLGCVRFFGGSGMKGDIHNSGLTVDVFVDKYLCLYQLEKAVNLLVALNWETYGAMCLISLHKIANYFFVLYDLKSSDIELMIKALETFTDKLSEDTKDEFSDQIFDLKRRLFFFLLRHNFYGICLNIAKDIEDYDLFMDLYNMAKNSKNPEHTETYFNYALATLQEENHGNINISSSSKYLTDSTCSRSPCCDIATLESKGQDILYYKQNNFLNDYMPPLPLLNSKTLDDELMKINIPKPIFRYKMDQPRHYEAKDNKSDTIMESNSIQNKTNHVKGSTQNINFNLSLSFRRTPDEMNGISTTINLPSSSSITAYSENVLPGVSSRFQCFPRPQCYQSTLKHLRNDFTIIPTSTCKVTRNNSQKTFSQLPRNYHPKFYQYPLISGTIPPTSNSLLSICQDDFKKRCQKKPSASILSNSTSIPSQNVSITEPSNLNGTNVSLISRETPGKVNIGEKNKVKFSDTVQVAVVPEILRKDKLIPQKRNTYLRKDITNPKKELADSLPLCHPNDDYLKDFNPISTGKVAEL